MRTLGSVDNVFSNVKAPAIRNCVLMAINYLREYEGI